MAFLRVLLWITTLYTLPFGLVFLVAPEWGLSLFGLGTNDVGIFIARYFAALALGIGVISGVSIKEIKTQLPPVSVYAGMFVAFGVTLGVSIYGLITGLLPFLIGVLVVGFDLFFTLGYGYFLFIGDPKKTNDA